MFIGNFSGIKECHKCGRLNVKGTALINDKGKSKNDITGMDIIYGKETCAYQMMTYTTLK